MAIVFEAPNFWAVSSQSSTATTTFTSHLPCFRPRWKRRNRMLSVSCEAGQSAGAPKLVTVLGKGGVGKTTAAVLIAKYFASNGRRTCLVVQGQEDKAADTLLEQKLTSLPVQVGSEALLSAMRVETTKLLLEPLAMLKAADARLGFSQGVLEEVAGEELSIIPGMDLAVAAAVLERLAKPAGGLLSFMTASSGGKKGAPAKGLEDEKFDVVVFDGASNNELLRLVAFPERARWYLKRFRALAEKTDVGRVALPSAARLLESIVLNGGGTAGGRDPVERTTADIWEEVERILSRRGVSELLVEVGDQRRSIAIPVRMQGKVAGAKFEGKTLTVTLRK
eukprot:TRINITY_DN943_c0_g1_i1.p1 TRINITY_DN943_c0_g1~~TRINITY_DN943_c0_g1_i1.p1  ORF type:complete len:337 (+),score=80.34 TRINITY_DN943_c0_g1_i1:71-1081(+)